MRERDHARARREPPLELLAHDVAALVDRRDDQARAGLLADHLPRHEVRVVLHLGDEHLVARPQPRPRVRLRHEVDRLGRPAHEHDLARRGGVEEAAHRLARRLVGGGRLLGERVHAAVHVRVVVR